MAALDERAEELETLSAIYPELMIDANDPYEAYVEVSITPVRPLLIRFVPGRSSAMTAETYARAATTGGAYIEHDVELSHLPPLSVQLKLPAGYPSVSPPVVDITTFYDWLPKTKIKELETEVVSLWEEYGCCQILFAYLDHLRQAAERGFDLDQSLEGCLVLPITAEQSLVDFDSRTAKAIFAAGTYDCGICLEPKKGSSCHKLDRCGHVFCLHCLQDFYNSAISEGDVSNIKCLSPDCGKGSPKKRKRSLHPRELLAMGLEESMVRRYVEMKRKKKLEADPNTIYCPRTWCQGPAKSAKYPPTTDDLSAYDALESASEDEGGNTTTTREDKSSTTKAAQKIPPDPLDRLAVCEKCKLAFCKVCYKGWHGTFARCFPRDPKELSAEEQASYDYIRLHTSPCPSCNSPTQKTMGCNHMRCFQCQSHFCYLCTSWLDSNNPYNHFNKPGTECYQRLWELEEGDEGQQPGDRRGFAGGRGWEQIALEVAREAEAEEAAQAARAAVNPTGPPAVDIDGLVVEALEEFQVNDGNGNERVQQVVNQRNVVPNLNRRGGGAAARR